MHRTPTLTMSTTSFVRKKKKKQTHCSGYNVCKLAHLTNSANCLPFPAPEFTPGFEWGSCYSIFSFICMFCRSLFVLLYFFFWPLCCLFFFDIRFLIALWYLQTLLHPIPFFKLFESSIIIR